MVLVLLAHMGLAVHAGHHALGEPQSGTSTKLVAGHGEPDSTLHLEGIVEERTLTCPGCLLQQQNENSQLITLRGVALPAPAEASLAEIWRPLLTRTNSARTARAPPSC